ncbi:MAG: response regulator, partial [Elusimicrobiota bacterium]|nr:response regulator [Elusimicrobiota bacterium]
MAKKIPIKKILIADDSEDTRELLKFTFEQAGYETSTVENGRELLRHVNEIKPDLIVLDLVMPVLDGLSALLELKKRLETKDIPVVVSSGKG